MGFMILLVTPIGGWMMLLYFILKLTIWYSPYLFYAPKMSFTSRDAMNVPLFQLRSSRFLPFWE